jgi:hypothetical protein
MLIRNSTINGRYPLEAVEIITFIYDLLSQSPTNDEKNNIRRWCKSAVRLVLRSYKPTDAEDAVTALQILRLVGLDLFTQE